MWRARQMACALVALVGISCVSNPAPQGWLPTPVQAASDPWGAWVTMTLTDTFTIAGELLGVDRDTVFVLPADGQVRRVPRDYVATARLAWFDADIEEVRAWGLLGAASTFSHGFGLVITMPIWIIAGTASAASESRAPLLEARAAGWDVLRRYSRFPGGVPDALPAQLTTRP